MSRFQAPPAGKRHAIGFAYSVQKDVYADFLFGNEVAVLGVNGRGLSGFVGTQERI